MARRPREYTIKVTHKYVHDPEAVERGLEAWAMFLARHLHELVAQQQQEEAEAGAEPGAEPAEAGTAGIEAAEPAPDAVPSDATEAAATGTEPAAEYADNAADPDRSSLTRPAARRRRRMRKLDA